jgi:hypothetical protein
MYCWCQNWIPTTANATATVAATAQTFSASDMSGLVSLAQIQQREPEEGAKKAKAREQR